MWVSDSESLYQSCPHVNIIYGSLSLGRKDRWSQVEKSLMYSSRHKWWFGVIHSITCGHGIHIWDPCVPLWTYSSLPALKTPPVIPSEYCLLSGMKISQALGSVLTPYLVFTHIDFSFHVYSWIVSYLLDDSVAELPRNENKVDSGHVLHKAGLSALRNGDEGRKVLCGRDAEKSFGRWKPQSSRREGLSSWGPCSEEKNDCFSSRFKLIFLWHLSYCLMTSERKK